MEEQAVDHPRPLRGRARVVMLLVAAGIVTDVLAIASEIDNLRVLNQLERGIDVSFDRVEASDNRVGYAGVAQILTYVASVVAFLAWFFRAYRNLPRLGARGPSHGFGWAIGSWFVPILNLFRPKQIANEVWRGSDPAAPPDQGAFWKDRPVSPLLHWWWAGWLVSSFLGNIAGRVYLNAETVSEQQAGTIVGIVSDSSYIVVGVLALLTVRAITERQEARMSNTDWAAPRPADLVASPNPALAGPPPSAPPQPPPPPV